MGGSQFHLKIFFKKCIIKEIFIPFCNMEISSYQSLLGLEKNRVGRSVKSFFLHYFFGQKCVFHACFTLIGSWGVEKTLG